MPESTSQVVVPQIANPETSSTITEKDIQMLGAVISSFAQPMAQAQQTVAIESTKQTKIIAEATQKTYRGFFIVAIGILVLAGLAMWRDKDQITEKLIIALLSFLGGLGVGKSLNK